VERTLARIEAGRLDVHELAKEYLADHIDNVLAYHAATWWEYARDHYRQVPADYLDGKLRLWMTRQGVNPKPQSVANLIAQLRAVVHVDPDEAMPCWLNKEAGDPDPGKVIAFRNGLLDVDRYLLTGDDQLIPHTPRWFSSVCLPYDYDPKAGCPRWQRCLREWLIDDDQIVLLQTWFGYTLVWDNSLQKFLFMLGPTRSGKSTVLNVLTRVLGRHNVAAASFQSLSTDFGLAELVGKSAATISEVHIDRSARNVVQTIKNLTGGDPVPVNRKGLPIVSLVLPVRVSIAANQLPRLPDDSNALKARMLLLHYPNSFLGKEDHGLAVELDQEVSGIATWALEGLRLLRQQGRFVQAERGKEYLDDFSNMSAPVEQFLADYCDEGPDLWEATESLYDTWRAWCSDEGHECCARNTFGAKLKAARPEVRNGQQRTPKGGKVRVYAGVQLNGDGVALLEKRFGRQAITARKATRPSQAVSGRLGQDSVRLADLAGSGVLG
jgi:putative DNA primase/helicase